MRVQLSLSGRAKRCKGGATHVLSVGGEKADGSSSADRAGVRFRRGVPCPSNINGLVKSGSVKRLTRSRRIMHRVTHLAAKESGAGRTPHLGAQRPPLNHLAASPDDALRNWCRETDRTLTRASAHGPGPTLPVGCAK